VQAVAPHESQLTHMVEGDMVEVGVDMVMFFVFFRAIVLSAANGLAGGVFLTNRLAGGVNFGNFLTPPANLLVDHCQR
jgi:hypothetical protein